MEPTEEEKKKVVKNRKYIRACVDQARVGCRAVEQGVEGYILVVKVESGNACTLSTLKLGTHHSSIKYILEREIKLDFIFF